MQDPFAEQPIITARIEMTSDRDCHGSQLASSYLYGLTGLAYAVTAGGWAISAIIDALSPVSEALAAWIFGIFLSSVVMFITFVQVQALRIGQICWNSEYLVPVLSIVVLMLLSVVYLAVATPVWGWDALWYWVEVAQQVLRGGTLPTEGHGSLGVYTLTAAAPMGEHAGVPTAQLLWLLVWMATAYSVCLYDNLAAYPLKLVIAVCLFLTTPLLTQALFSVGYFDVHMALCSYLSLVYINRLKLSHGRITRALEIAMALGLIVIGCTLKTTFLLLGAILGFCWLVQIAPRVSAIVAIIAVPAAAAVVLEYGLHIEAFGKTLSLDWDRHPQLMMPGLWTSFDNPDDASRIAINFLDAILRNASFSLLPLTFILCFFIPARNGKPRIDLRVLFTCLYLLSEVVLQMFVPYFYEGSSDDTRFSRMLVVILIPLASYVTDKLTHLTCPQLTDVDGKPGKCVSDSGEVSASLSKS